MCQAHENQDRGHIHVGDRTLKYIDPTDLLQVARFLSGEKELRRTALGFLGFGATKPGDRVLLGVDTQYDSRVYDAIATALREKGAKVDVVIADVGPDREFDHLDEIRATIRREPWVNNPRRWEGTPWIEELAARGGYDLLVHGKGGGAGLPEKPDRIEACPWLVPEHLAHECNLFPRDLHLMINTKTWEKIYKQGRGGKVHLTDPEGTDLTYTLYEEYYDGTRYGFTENPLWGHLHGHPPTPIVKREDAEGIVAGTTSHFARPFPLARLHVKGGCIEKVDGGGAYGEAWNQLIKESRDIQYPCFPRPGLFWLWEVAIGTNPKVARPSNIKMQSSGGFEWERRRSGVIHTGFGTRWRGSEEVWAGKKGLVYGHLHIHLLFPTMKIYTPSAQTVTVIEHGHLTALDDPEVRELARKYGDPDKVLREDWIPKIPGISAPGSYTEFARNPAAFIYAPS